MRIAGYKESAIDAYKRATDIENLQESLTKTISDNAPTSAVAETRIKAVSIIFSSPIINVNELKEQLDVSYNTANQVNITRPKGRGFSEA